MSTGDIEGKLDQVVQLMRRLNYIGEVYKEGCVRVDSLVLCRLE